MKLKAWVLLGIVIFCHVYAAEKFEVIRMREPLPPTYAASESTHFKEDFLDETRHKVLPHYVRKMSGIAQSFLHGNNGFAKEPLTALAISTVLVDVQVDNAQSSVSSLQENPEVLLGLIGMLYSGNFNAKEKLEYLTLAVREGIETDLIKKVLPRGSFNFFSSFALRQARSNKGKYFPHAHTPEFISSIYSGDSSRMIEASEQFSKNNDPLRSLAALVMAIKMDSGCAPAQNCLGLHYHNCRSQIIPFNSGMAKKCYLAAHAIDPTHEVYRYNICMADITDVAVVSEHYKHLSAEDKKMVDQELIRVSRTREFNQVELDGYHLTLAAETIANMVKNQQEIYHMGGHLDDGGDDYDSGGFDFGDFGD